MAALEYIDYAQELMGYQPDETDREEAHEQARRLVTLVRQRRALLKTEAAKVTGVAQYTIERLIEQNKIWCEKRLTPQDNQDYWMQYVDPVQVQRWAEAHTGVPDGWDTARALAQRFGVSKDWLYKKVRAGKLPGQKRLIGNAWQLIVPVSELARMRAVG